MRPSPLKMEPDTETSIRIWCTRYKFINERRDRGKQAHIGDVSDKHGVRGELSRGKHLANLFRTLFESKIGQDRLRKSNHMTRRINVCVDHRPTTDYIARCTKRARGSTAARKTQHNHENVSHLGRVARIPHPPCHWGVVACLTFQFVNGARHLEI